MPDTDDVRVALYPEIDAGGRRATDSASDDDDDDDGDGDDDSAETDAKRGMLFCRSVVTVVLVVAVVKLATTSGY